MKRTVKYEMAALLVVVLTTMVGCSTKGDDGAYMELPPSQAEALMYDTGIYDGEWTVNKQVVDTARLVVRTNGVIEVRLPESYLLELCFPDDVGNKKSGNIANLIEVYQQGYSEQSQYMSFYSNTIKTDDAKNCFGTFSFQATIEDEPCSITLLSYENATAVMQTTTGQWTLGIPIDAFLVKNLSTAKSTERKLSIPVTLYYNTKRRIM